MHLNWTQPAFFHNFPLHAYLNVIRLYRIANCTYRLNCFLFSFDKHTMIKIILPISHLADSSTIHFIIITSLP